MPSSNPCFLACHTREVWGERLGPRSCNYLDFLCWAQDAGDHHADLAGHQRREHTGWRLGRMLLLFILATYQINLIRWFDTPKSLSAGTERRWFLFLSFITPWKEHILLCFPVKIIWRFVWSVKHGMCLSLVRVVKFNVKEVLEKSKECLQKPFKIGVINPAWFLNSLESSCFLYIFTRDASVKVYF